jgi:hypothetical protein
MEKASLEMNVQLARTTKNTIIEDEISSLKRQIFEHEINIAKWSVYKADHSVQIEAALETIDDLVQAIDAISQL